MTQSVEALENALITAIYEISDDIERYRTVRELEERLGRSFKEVKAATAQRLHKGRSWSEVGKLLGVTGSRAEQISRGAR